MTTEGPSRHQENPAEPLVEGGEELGKAAEEVLVQSSFVVDNRVQGPVPFDKFNKGNHHYHVVYWDATNGSFDTNKTGLQVETWTEKPLTQEQMRSGSTQYGKEPEGEQKNYLHVNLAQKDGQWIIVNAFGRGSGEQCMINPEKLTKNPEIQKALEKKVRDLTRVLEERIDERKVEKSALVEKQRKERARKISMVIAEA